MCKRGTRPRALSPDLRGRLSASERDLVACEVDTMGSARIHDRGRLLAQCGTSASVGLRDNGALNGLRSRSSTAGLRSSLACDGSSGNHRIWLPSSALCPAPRPSTRPVNIDGSDTVGRRATGLLGRILAADARAAGVVGTRPTRLPPVRFGARLSARAIGASLAAALVLRFRDLQRVVLRRARGLQGLGRRRL